MLTGMNARDKHGCHSVLHALWYTSCVGSLRGEIAMICLFGVTDASPSISSGSREPERDGVPHTLLTVPAKYSSTVPYYVPPILPRALFSLSELLVSYYLKLLLQLYQ